MDIPEGELVEGFSMKELIEAASNDQSVENHAQIITQISDTDWQALINFIQ